MPRHLFQVTVNLPASFRNNLNNNEVFNPYAFVRNRLYHFVFHRFCLLYNRVFSEVKRKIIEFIILLASFFCFITLVYVHIVFVKTPMTCLEGYRDIWQRNGILRVEVLSKKGKDNYTLEDSYWKERTLRHHQFESQSHFIFAESSLSDIVEVSTNEETDSTENDDGNRTDLEMEDNNSDLDALQFNKVFDEAQLQPVSEESILASDPEGSYIMEFSLEYGLLRLRPSKRRDLNISVTFVILDPEVDKCFGGSVNRFLLDKFLGYDNVLLSSIKTMAERKDQKGFVRNAVADIEYIFINNWSNEKSYITAGFVMLLFTLTISTLLRHSHQQIFVVVANFFDVVWPRNLIPSAGAPVLMVILALVGMEAVMSDFFHDRSIALHIIILVWFADLYDAVCCQSRLAKRHWFRFFYLYHFLFYAYNYKFGGVYWPLTLLTSWMFTLHSMVFFFHHYELPQFLHRAARMNAFRGNQHQPPDNEPPDNAPPDNDPEDHSYAETDVDLPPYPADDNMAEAPTSNETIDNDVILNQTESTDSLVTDSTASSDCSESQLNCCEDNHSLQIQPEFVSALNKAHDEHSYSCVELSQRAVNMRKEQTRSVCDNFGKNKDYSAKDLYKVLALQKSPNLTRCSYIGCITEIEKDVKYVSPHSVMEVN